MTNPAQLATPAISSLTATAQSTLLQKQPVRCIAVASGKGGVGKTVMCTNLALAFSQLNCRVLLVDADLGLANTDIMLGVTPRFTLLDAVLGGREMAEVVTPCLDGVDLLAACSGSREMAALGDGRMRSMIKELMAFASAYDVVLLDCASGINNSVLSFVGMAPQDVIVATGQPTSIMDVYALLKVMNQRQLATHAGLVVNMATTDAQGHRVFDTLTRVTARFLPIELELMGIIPESRHISEAVTRRRPFMVDPKGDEEIAERMLAIARMLLEGRPQKGKKLNDDHGENR